jgi:POT family proton-dependent oligopeptide transporter
MLSERPSERRLRPAPTPDPKVLAVSEAPRPTPVLGHPPGLYILAVTEVWERFSYYGMRALLVYYMTKHLLLPQAASSTIYGAYTATVWITPFLGGIVADRWLGQHRAVLLGGSMMALGHFMMAVEALFYPALALIACGTGFFKPNISTQVGDLYAAQDRRRDHAYSIFYVGLNFGAFVAPLGCGTVGELYGWHYGFALAGVGMLAGLGIYVYGGRWLPPDRLRMPRPAPDAAQDSDGTARIVALVAISLCASLFWAAFEQQGNAIALWADGYTDRILHLGAWSFTIPATWFQSLNGMYIVVLTPLILAYWRRQGAREPRTLDKMVIGAAIGGVAFLLLAFAALRQETHGAVSWLWLVGYFALLTTGELYLSPTCLSLFNKVSPGRVASTMLGVWYGSLFLGSYLAGYSGTYWESTRKPVYFGAIALLSLGSAAALYVVGRTLAAKLEPAAGLRPALIGGAAQP